MWLYWVEPGAVDTSASWMLFGCALLTAGPIRPRYVGTAQPETTSVPVMYWWMEQMYGYLPGVFGAVKVLD